MAGPTPACLACHKRIYQVGDIWIHVQASNHPVVTKQNEDNPQPPRRERNQSPAQEANDCADFFEALIKRNILRDEATKLTQAWIAWRGKTNELG